MDINNFDAIEIGLASSKKIRGWSSRRGHQARDDQLPHAEAREGRALLRAHLRSDQGLGVLLRQVQAGPLQGHRLRALRRRGDPLQGPPRAHGPHRPGRAGLAHLVLQGRPVADRLPDRHGSQGAREGPLLRRLDRHLDRRGGPPEGPRRSSRRRSTEGRRRLRPPSASSAPRSSTSRSSAGTAWLEGERRRSRSFDDEDQLWADDARRQADEARRRRAHEAGQGDCEGVRRRDLRHRGLPRRRDRAHARRSGRSSRR